MDERAIAFLEAMIAIAVIGVVCFLIFLVSRQALRATAGGRPVYQPRWYELVLAAAFLALVAIVALWRLVPGSGAAWGGDGRATTFLVVMLVAGGGAVLVFVLSLFWRLSRAEAAAPAAATSSRDGTERGPLARHRTPSALRLLGLLGFAVVFLVFNWSHTAPAERHLMMMNLIYPAGLAIALVMLFDKASRAWDIKAPGESLREWLYANALLGLYLIAYRNLSEVADRAAYAGMFWDMLHVAAFLLVLWVLDRKVSRLRFLLTHAWLVALPILLLIWRAQMGIEPPADISWWDTIWPFFFLALAAFVLELIIQVASDRGVGISTLKDVVFLAVYVILLIAARPTAVA